VKISQRRFPSPYWQFTLTATDANRFAHSNRARNHPASESSSFHYCYHGTVDESFARLDTAWLARAAEYRPAVNPAETTRVVELTSQGARSRLKHHDVACILAEPAMTKRRHHSPRRGYWKSARELARRYGSLLIADRNSHHLRRPRAAPRMEINPDILVFGKAIGSGHSRAPSASPKNVAQRITARIHLEDLRCGGIAELWQETRSRCPVRATLEHILTPAAFEV